MPTVKSFDIHGNVIAVNSMGDVVLPMAIPPPVLSRSLLHPRKAMTVQVE